MALVLKRITNPYECVKCSITRKIISYGEEYLEDDEDGTIVDFNYYYDKKFNKKIQDAQSLVTESMDRFAYQQVLLQREREFLDKTILDRPLADTNCLSWDDYQATRLNNINKDNSPTYINKQNANTAYMSPKGGK